MTREVTEEMVEEAAAAILSAEEREDCFDLAWGRKVIAAGKDAPHFGDCTKNCCTCVRCTYEDYTRIARAAISAAIAAAPQINGSSDVR